MAIHAQMNETAPAGEPRLSSGVLSPDMKYTVRLAVPSYLTDGLQRLTPASFMDLAQEMAYVAAARLHFGYDELGSRGTAWVLSRMYFRFLRTPRWREVVDLSTWHKGAQGPFYLRDFRMADLQGEPLVEGTSSWVVLDVENRRLVRSSEVVEMVPENTVCPDAAVSEPAPRLVFPAGAEAREVAVHPVRYSDVDLLGHTNNTRYVMWSMDGLDYDLVSQQPVRDVCVNFNRETRPGEQVRLSRCRDAAGAWFVRGDVEGKNAFLARFRFGDEAALQP